MVRSTASVALIFALCGFSRYLDSFIRLFLRQETGEAFLPALFRNWSPADAGREVVNLLGLGFALWFAFALLIAWLGNRRVRRSLVDVSRAFYPSLLAVGLSFIACLSLVLSPIFPYGINLVLTLAYESSFASILVWSLLGYSLITTLLRHIPMLTFRTDGSDRFLRRAAAAAMVLALTAAFALLTPSEFWQEGEGQGHMLRYLRMTATLAGSGTLDIDRAEAVPDQARPLVFLSRVPHMLGRGLREAGALVKAVASAALEGKLYLGSLRATRANRAMFVHPDGGIYYIMNPGPALLLLPAYLADQVVNPWAGTERQVAVVLFWNFLGALLLLEMARLAFEVAGVSVPVAVAAALVLGFASPILFYTYQVYPELPAALFLVYVFRKLLVDPAPRGPSMVVAGMAIAFLPWLHQKYLLTATVIGVLVIWKLARVESTWPSRLRRIGPLVAPLALSAFALLVYNHALTGSILPDATYRAAGRGTFSPEYTLRGTLGLFLDVENGLLVFAPVYLLALVGAGSLIRKHRTAVLYLFAIAGSYLLIVGSVPYWSGPVSSVARFMLFLSPLAAPAVALAIARARVDGVVAGFTVTAFAATASLTVSFLTDRIPTYFTKLLLTRAWYSDPYQYLPNFHSDGLFGSGPGHFYKLVAVLTALGLIGWLLGQRLSDDRRYNSHEAERFPRLASSSVAVVLCLLLFAGVLLERLPGNESEKTGAVYRDTRPLEAVPDGRLAVLGKYGFEGAGVWVPGEGETRFIIQSRTPLRQIELLLRNGLMPNRIQIRTGGSSLTELPFERRQREVLSIPLDQGLHFEGPDGQEWIYQLAVRSISGFVPSQERDSEDRRRLGCYVVFRGG